MTLFYIETHPNQSWNMETMGGGYWQPLVNYGTAQQHDMTLSPTPNITQTGHQILTVQVTFLCK